MLNTYASGSGGGVFRGGASNSSNSSSTEKAASRASKSAEKAAKDTTSAIDKIIEKFSELFDWIEVRIDRLQRKIDLKTAKSDNAVGYQNKNTYLSDAQDYTDALIKANTKGAKKYQKQADKIAKEVGLSKRLKKRVDEGAIDIESLDEENRKRVEAYKEWKDKALDCKQAVEELKASQRELAEQKFDNIVEQYDNMLDHIEHSANMINGYIDQAETQGYIVSGSYYQSLIQNAQSSISAMQAERAALQQSLNESMASGIIVQGSNEWYEMQSQINEVDESIQEANTSIIEFNNSIRQISWDIFDRGMEAIDRLADEADFLTELMSSDKLFDDKGMIMEQGLATAALYGANYDAYMRKADEYREEMKRINQELANDPNNVTLLDRRNELLELQQESILAAEDEKQAMKDLVKEGIDAELNALRELIDKYNEALQSQKDLFEYQKDVADQSKEIAALQKQLSVFGNDTSEEGRLKVQEIKNQLEEAQSELQETEYDKYISDQEELLDELYTEYEEVLNRRLDNIDALMASMIQVVNDKSDLVAQTLKEESQAVGYTITDGLNSIFGNGGTALAMYTETFSTGVTTINTTLSYILEAVRSLPVGGDSGSQSANAGADTGSGAGGNGSSNIGSTVSDAVSGAVDSIKNPEGSTPKPIGGNDNSGDKEDKILKIINSGMKHSGKLTSEEKKKHSDLWEYLVKNYKREPTYAIYSKLGDALGIKVDNPATLAQSDKILKALKKKGYASGTRRAPVDYAWTQEKGPELIVTKSGAVLSPVKGAAIFKAEATKTMYDFANNPSGFLHDTLKQNVTNVAPVNNAGNMNANIQNDITFNLPNVTNYEEFMNKMTHDPKAEKFVQSVTIGAINGKSSLNKYKIKW